MFQDLGLESLVQHRCHILSVRARCEPSFRGRGEASTSCFEVGMCTKERELWGHLGGLAPPRATVTVD